MRTTLAILLLCMFSPGFSQSNVCDGYALMFFNVENLFDCRDDTTKLDEEFLPDGDKRWSYKRMHRKLAGISKTILAANAWAPPSIIGLCEVENEWVLQRLIYDTGLSALRYDYLHYESNDRRGIDVALLYRKDHLKLLSTAAIELSDSTRGFFTRDALYLKGIIATDTVHLIINHWPSKRGGSLHSEAKRLEVARRIASHIDSIKQAEANPKLIVMGDFNAEYNSPAIETLKVSAAIDSYLKPSDINRQIVGGSYKYQGQWSLIDHIFISNSWMSDMNYQFNHKVAGLPFLLTSDPTYSGEKPNRTYIGPRYNGGISDHLPVVLSICKNSSVLDSAALGRK